MHQITPSLVQDWVTKAAADGLSPRSIRKYHTMLHSIFKRAVRDQLITTNPCEHTELPKAITKKARTLTPTEYELLIAAIPARYRLLVETAIETGMRWGELIALRPRHIAFLTRAVPVEETILEVSRRYSPTGQNYVTRPTPRTTNPETSASTNTGSTPSPTASELTSRCSPPPPAPPSHATLPHPHLATRRQDQRHRLPVRMHDLRTRPRLLAPRRRVRPQVRDGTDGPRADPNHPEIPPRPPRSRPQEPRRSRRSPTTTTTTHIAHQPSP